MERVKFLSLLLFILVAIPCHATWSLKQTVVVSSCVTDAANNCLFTPGSTVTIGSAIVIAAATATNATFNGVTCVPACTTTTWVEKGHTFLAGAGNVDTIYTTNITVAATSLKATWSANSGSGPGKLYEFAFTSSPASFDASNAATNASCSTCAWPSLTVSGNNAVIVGVATCGQVCGAPAPSGYTTIFTSGDGFAYLLNATSYSAPNWTQAPSSNIAMIVLDLTEPATTSTCTSFKALKGVGCL